MSRKHKWLNPDLSALGQFLCLGSVPKKMPQKMAKFKKKYDVIVIVQIVFKRRLFLIRYQEAKKIIEIYVCVCAQFARNKSSAALIINIMT